MEFTDKCFSLEASTDSPNPLPSGPGAAHPDIEPLLREFADVLQSEIPGGLPHQRFAADGSDKNIVLKLLMVKNHMLGTRHHSPQTRKPKFANILRTF